MSAYGFFTDDNKVHPLTSSQPRQGSQAVFAHQEPRSVKQAAAMIAKREIPVKTSYDLFKEYERVNTTFFKGKVKEPSIMLANLPYVKNRAFAIPQANIVVINTAKANTLEEQKPLLRHELLHIAGLSGHDFRFESWARTIDAPFMYDEEGGKGISGEEYTKIKIDRAVERAKAEQTRREQKYGTKKGEGDLIRNGRPVARVIMYQGKRGVVTGKTVANISDIPKSVEDVVIVTFDALGYPKRKSQIIPRDQLVNYTFG